MRINKKDKIALSLLGGAVALYFLFQFALFPVWDSMQEARSNLPLEEKKLDKYRAAALTLGLRKSEANSVEARLREAETGLLNSKTAALASAEMQRIAMDFITAQQIDVRSTDFVPVKALSPEYTQVPLSLTFQCRIDQLSGFLRDLQGNPKYLTVPKLLIQSSGNTKVKTITVSMTIAGFMRTEEKK